MQKFGFELEFSAIYDSKGPIQSNLPSGFELGTDVSANYGWESGFEVRSKIFKQGLPRKKFKEVLGVLKANNARIHKNCGFHIHFSGFGNLDLILATHLLKQKKYHWDSRSEWCEHTGKYVPIRKLEGDHYEIRVFNSTLNLRAICKYYEFTRKIINACVVNQPNSNDNHFLAS